MANGPTMSILPQTLTKLGGDLALGASPVEQVALANLGAQCRGNGILRQVPFTGRSARHRSPVRSR
jgi:hypothetical protein